MSNTWELTSFSAKEIQEKLKSGKFVVPTFQRGAVWNEQQKRTLADSIKKGLPFGTLLLYGGEDKDIVETYKIIDGLQRSSTVSSFVLNPTSFFDEEEDIESKVIINIVALVKGNNNRDSKLEEQIKRMLIYWVKEHENMQSVESMQYSLFGKALSDHMPDFSGKEFKVGELIEPMMIRYKDICKRISNTKIPAIVMYGDDEFLPELFERINSKGTQLSKYQIFAAMWNKNKFKIHKNLNELVKFNGDRYENMLEIGTLDQWNHSDFIKKMELNTFEICFGLGKYLKKHYPHLFGPFTDKNITIVDSVGFSLLNACMCLNQKDMKSLANKLMGISKKIDVNDFIIKIIEAIKVVDDVVGKYNKFKLNSRTIAGPLHSEYQIISMIVNVFLMQHANIVLSNVDTIEEVSYDMKNILGKWKQNKQVYKANAGKIYTLGILNGMWGNSGDKILNKILVNADYYCRIVSSNALEKALDEYFNTLNGERNEWKRVSTPKEADRLILALVYINSFTANNTLDNSKYDIEHLATQKLMKQHLDRFNGGLRLPISSIGNLCLLPEYANRSKKEQTIYSDQEYLIKSHLKIQDVEKEYSFTQKNDLEWIEDEKLDKNDLEGKYLKFIQNRFATMKDKILHNFASI